MFGSSFTDFAAKQKDMTPKRLGLMQH